MKNLACGALTGRGRRIGGADRLCGHIQCSITQSIDIALAGIRKLDNPSRNYFLGEVGWACNSRTSHFECDAHETRRLVVEVPAV
jgi:hypothetical protein